MTNNQRSTRGASTVEFALLTVAIVIVGAAGFRALGHSVARASADGTSALEGNARVVRVAHLPPAIDRAARR